VALILVGLNHRTAPVALREQFSLTGCALDMALADLAEGLSGAGCREPGRPAGVDRDLIEECVILSTCNRLEIYATAHDAAAGWAALERFLSDLQGVPVAQLRPHLYFWEERPVVEHLMRVACGLDSMILGEPQILGQVADAFASAQAAHTTGLILSHLFARAIHTGKRGRNETDISRHTTSVSHAAARLACEQVGDLRRANVLVVGAGDMAELAAQALQEHGAAAITFINRTYSRAEGLACQFSGRALNWHHLPDALAAADLVVTATGAPHVVIHRDNVAGVLDRRAGRPLVLIDIAVPRDVAEDVGELPGVQLWDIDDLQEALDANQALREAAAPAVEAIIAQETDGFFDWLNGRQVVPVLVALRRKAEAVAEAELQRALHRLDETDPQVEQVISLLTHRLVNKLLHEPTVRLRSEAARGNGIVYAAALSDLFALDTESTFDPVLTTSAVPKPIIPAHAGIQSPGHSRAQD